MIKHIAPTANHSASKYPGKTGYLEGVNLSWCPVGIRIDVPGNCSMRRLERLFWCATYCTAQAGFSSSETRNAVAKHELIEIIRITKDRVPLRDALLTDAEKELNMGSLVPIQKGRQLVEQEVFSAAARKSGALVSNCSISGSNGSITTKACARRSTTG